MVPGECDPPADIGQFGNVTIILDKIIAIHSIILVIIKLCTKPLRVDFNIPKSPDLTFSWEKTFAIRERSADWRCWIHFHTSYVTFLGGYHGKARPSTIVTGSGFCNDWKGAGNLKWSGNLQRIAHKGVRQLCQVIHLNIIPIHNYCRDGKLHREITHRQQSNNTHKPWHRPWQRGHI